MTRARNGEATRTAQQMHPSAAVDRDQELARLRREVQLATESSEREADAMFAQYQLSQLIAWGTTRHALVDSVLTELARLCQATVGLCWLADLHGEELCLVAGLGSPQPEAPAEGSPDQIRAWLRGSAGWMAVELEDKDGLAGIVALRDATGSSLDPAGVRVAKLTRHELAIALRNVQLREALEEERRAATAIIESATDAILEFSIDGKVRQANPSAQKLFGRDAQEAIQLTCNELLGCSQLDLHSADACPIMLAGQRGKAIEYLETSVLGAEGQPVRVSGSVSPVFSSTGTVSSLTMILRDVEAQAALGQLRESFVATVSHELRTPLTLIRGYAESLRLLPLDDEKRRKFSAGIELQADRIAALIRGILDISHVDADPMALETTAVTVEELVRQLHTMMPMDELDARLKVDIPFGLPPVSADPHRIGQVLRNLVENAVKYGPPDGAIEIAAFESGPRVQIFVQDEGKGVPKSERRMATEPFHRGPGQRESSSPGYGLGLYIARRLVEAHGGQLQLTDRPDGKHGTRAVFSLPVANGRPDAPAPGTPR
jgi:PAS domain S-box-containing protein